MASKGEKFRKTVEVLGPVNTKAKKGGNKFMKVQVTHVVPQGKMNKDGSYTRTGNKTIVMTEKWRLVEYVMKKDKKHVHVLAKIKRRSASGNFLLGIKKIAHGYNQSWPEEGAGQSECKHKAIAVGMEDASDAVLNNLIANADKPKATLEGAAMLI